jgi:3-phenylpropionate/cinnamic acid dioxygenase small subunit
MGAREGIERTILRYAWSYDEFDVDGYLECFTDDAVVEVSAPGVEPVRGKHAIRDFFLAARGGRAEAGQQPRHSISNVFVDSQDGGEATARAYMTLFVTHSDGTLTTELTGTYHDRLREVDGDWRLVHRRIVFDRDVDFRGRKHEAG